MRRQRPCYLTRLIGARVVVAISISPDVRWRSYVQPGIEMPVHAAATAKAIIAYQSEAVLAEAISADLPLLTANTRNDRAWIEQELAAVRTRGYATCIGEIDEGLAAIAVAVFLSDRRVFYALGMTGPLQRIMNEQLPERLAACGQNIGAIALNWRETEIKGYSGTLIEHGWKLMQLNPDVRYDRREPLSIRTYWGACY
ncbi:IclR family transcriptional regulator domain-containing protein [Bradyrhizobium ottawaense]|uniref:IclR family transcriptional regulator domain-containing protein n=1 Tax=Bradyrhizobium ottawaense TaxID=931866 RepID=UPI003FA06DDD